MRVLQVHNRYRRPGGEDTVLANEARLLREQGHQVDLLEVRNDEHDPQTLGQKLAAARDVVWSAAGTAAMDDALGRFRPDVVHVHNTFNKLSPAVLRTAAARRVAVVHTLHNFRALCANGLLLREGRPCELCLDSGRLNAIRHRCYRGSRAASAVVTFTGALHLRAGTFAQRGLRLIALTEFARAVFLRGGVDARVLRVKPNFVYPSAVTAPREQRIVFVGRLAPEKGVDLLLDAWRRLRPPGWTLDLLGDGEVGKDGARDGGEGVRFLGWRSPPEVMQSVAGARFLVMASRWYETFGMVLVEAFSAGTPVIVPALGAMGELVDDGVSGFCFTPGSVESLVQTMAKAIALPPAAWQTMSEAAARSYEQRFSPATNYQQLMAIYREAIDEAAP